MAAASDISIIWRYFCTEGTEGGSKRVGQWETYLTVPGPLSAEAGMREFVDAADLGVVLEDEAVQSVCGVAKGANAAGGLGDGLGGHGEVRKGWRSEEVGVVVVESCSGGGEPLPSPLYTLCSA